MIDVESVERATMKTYLRTKSYFLFIKPSSKKKKGAAVDSNLFFYHLHKNNFITSLALLLSLKMTSSLSLFYPNKRHAMQTASPERERYEYK
jgi:hypothetical protein